MPKSLMACAVNIPNSVYQVVYLPRLSVLMPARNAASTIGLAVRSTLRDLPSDAELVVLDDASTDATSGLLALMAQRDKRLRIRRTEVNLGVAEGLNHLIKVTSSEQVARMDADDVCLPGRFRSQQRALERQGVDVLFSGVVSFGRTSPWLRPAVPQPVSPAAAPFALLFENVFAHSTMYADRSVLEKNDCYRRVPAEDYDLWMRIATSGDASHDLLDPGFSIEFMPNRSLPVRPGSKDRLPIRRRFRLTPSWSRRSQVAGGSFSKLL